jgi:DNA replication ATP-dependent helicase Dna2
MSERAADLLKRMRKLVKDEVDAQLEQLERQWSEPLTSRVYTGKAIEGLRYEGVSDRGGHLILTCQTNNSRFREGDCLFLHRGSSPLLADYAEGTLELDDEHYLEVSLQKGNLEHFHDAPTGWVADEGFVDMSDYYLDALTEAGSRQVGRKRILPLILDDLVPSVDLSRYERAMEAAKQAGLNPRQAEAVAHAYATDLAHLIQGPPGTGKTIVLAHIARLLAQEGERVLVTSLTHRAINNALNKVAEVDPELPSGKIGQPSRADGLAEGVSNDEWFDGSRFAEMDGGYVIGATPFATQTRRLAQVEFDTVLFDEASQITLPLALMGMLSGKRYVFIGDHKQLPPVVTHQGDGSLSSYSIFDYLADRGYRTMLNLTYRLNDRLAAWPSRMFYDGELEPAPGVGERRLSLPHVPAQWQAILDPDQPAVFVDLDQRNTTIRSYREAEIVTDLVCALIECGLSPEQVGVVSPYRAQGREIRNRLRRLLPDRQAQRAIVVDTVERMQGQERDVILVSLATSSLSFAERLAGFFYQPQRLNVTITRPRTKLIIVGSRQVARAIPSTPELCKWVGWFDDLLRSCTRHAVSYEEA